MLDVLENLFIFSILDKLLRSVELAKLSCITFSHYFELYLVFLNFDWIHFSCHVSRLELTIKKSLNLSILQLTSSASPV